MTVNTMTSRAKGMLMALVLLSMLIMRKYDKDNQGGMLW